MIEMYSRKVRACQHISTKGAITWVNFHAAISASKQLGALGHIDVDRQNECKQILWLLAIPQAVIGIHESCFCWNCVSERHLAT